MRAWIEGEFSTPAPVCGLHSFGTAVAEQLPYKGVGVAALKRHSNSKEKNQAHQLLLFWGAGAPGPTINSHPDNKKIHFQNLM